MTTKAKQLALARNKKKSPAVRGMIGGQKYAVTNYRSLGPLGLFDDDGSMTVERTELFLTVQGSSTANAFRSDVTVFFPMAPTLSWLRNFANSYSQYEVHKLEFTYVPQVPTTQAGSIAMCFYADTIDSSPITMGQMLSTEQSLFAPVYAGSDGGAYLNRFGGRGNIVGFQVPQHAIAYGDGTPKMFKVVNPGTYTATANTQALFTPGELVVATEGLSANLIVGQVFVRYRIRLRGPINLNTQS